VKYLVLLALASLAAGITLAATQHSTAPCRKWHNLCIPKKYDPVLGRDFLPGHPAPNGLVRWAKQLPGTDVSTVPSATFDFTEKEMAAAIPGYIAKRWVSKGGFYQYFGIQVIIKPASLAPEEKISLADRVLYNLDGTFFNGDFSHAVIEKLPGLPYYKIAPVFPGTQMTQTVWDMVSVNLRDKGKRPPIKPLTWYMGSCYDTPEVSSASSFTCNRTLTDPKFPYYIQYDVEQPNAHLIPEIDAFIEKKIRSWEISQPSQRKR